MKLDDAQFAATIGKHLSDAIHYDAEDREPARLRVINYMAGEMADDTPSAPGRSAVTTSEVADIINWMMPGLMRVFAGSAGVVQYEPKKPKNAAEAQAAQAQAEQATDYVQAIFDSEFNGYSLFWQWFTDSLQHGNGIIKYWWEKTEDIDRATYDSLTEDQIALLKQEPGITITGWKQNEDGTLAISIERKEVGGELNLRVVPPEDFLIDRNARCLDEAVFVAHRSKMTRSSLIEMGYDRQTVDDLPAYAGVTNTLTDVARNGVSSFARVPAMDDASDLIEYFECYARLDINDDGVSELVKVCCAGSASGPVILYADESEDDDAPFIDLPCEIVPHRWRARSVAESALDIQRVNTALMRQTLDNLYMSNMPQRFADETRISNPAELMNPSIGGVVRTKGNPREAIMDAAVPFTAQASLSAMQFMGAVLQRRTGLSQATAMLTEDALVPQTATAKQIEHDASYARLEVIARTFAETGVRKLFAVILKMLTEHSAGPRAAFVKGEWVEFDPRTWQADMEVRINVGLGTGTRERDLMMLTRIAMEQDKVVAQLGPMNPVVTPSMWVDTRQKMAACAGLRNPEQFFASVTDQSFQQFLQEQQATKPPDPKLIEVQQRLQLEHMKMQADAKREDARMAAELQLKREELMAESQLSAIKIATQGGHATQGDVNLRNVSGL